MDAPAHRSFTPTRIVALALIALAVLGLGYLYFASGSDSVSVPKGAHAGQLTLHSCTTRRRRAATPPTAARWSCPRTGTTRSSRLIALPVKRIRALSAHPREPVFRLQGGPGLTNMDFTDASRYRRQP